MEFDRGRWTFLLKLAKQEISQPISFLRNISQKIDWAVTFQISDTDVGHLS